MMEWFSTMIPSINLRAGDRKTKHRVNQVYQVNAINEEMLCELIAEPLTTQLFPVKAVDSEQ